MKALITGGAGFIGSHLAEKLLKLDYEVTVLDDLSTGSLDNISNCKKQENFQFIKGNIRDGNLVDELCRKNDLVFHLAAAVGVKLIADDPVHTIETNIAGTEVVLDMANKYKRKIFIASTSEVYGKSEVLPFEENGNLILGSTIFSRWSYACSKAIDEFLGFAFHRQYGLDVIIGRFFNTIGPRQTGKYGMVIPRFVESALNNEPLMVYGTGEQRRCFCYVKDVVEAVVGLMSCKNAPGKIYNIGSTEEVSINQLAEKIINLTNSKSRKEHISYREAYGVPIEDMTRRLPSLKRIKNTIGWEPKTNLTDALKHIINHFEMSNKK